MLPLQQTTRKPQVAGGTVSDTTIFFLYMSKTLDKTKEMISVRGVKPFWYVDPCPIKVEPLIEIIKKILGK